MPAQAAYAAQTDGSAAAAEVSSQAPGSGWQKTFDRHELASAAYGNGVYVAVGADGEIKVSTDAENWTAVNNSGNMLQSVAWGGDRFVAAGSLGKIMTSADGRNWATVSSGTDKDLKGVAWNGTEFAVVGDRGTLLVSKDGTSWTKVSMDKPYSLSGVISGNGKFIVTTSDTFNLIFVSDDGQAWNAAEPKSGLYGYYNPAFNGDTFLMYGKIANQSGYAALTSKDGVNWTEVQNAPNARSITAIGGSFVAVGDSVRGGDGSLAQSIYLSDDGTSWQTNSAKWNGGDYSDLRYIYQCNGRLIGINYFSELFTSTDGLQWSRETSGLDHAYDKITWDGGQLVAYDQDGNMETSKDGTNWTKSPVKLDFGGPVINISYLKNHTIIVFAGSPARMYVTKDGTNWTSHDIEGLQYARVIQSGDQYLLFTSDAVYVSADAEKWDKLGTDPQSLMTKSAAYDGKTYVSVGGQGAIAGGEGNVSDPYRIIGTSGDLTKWNVVKTDKTSSLTSVVWAGGQFVAVGDSGTILTSKDGLSGWTKASAPTAENLLSVVWDGSKYIASGEKGTILYSQDGTHWIKDKSATSDFISRVIPTGDSYLALGWNTIMKKAADPAGQAEKFKDVRTHWAKVYIDELAGRSLINGVDGENFAPDRAITRAEFAAIITRALGLKPAAGESFSDVRPTDWYYGSVSAAFENGILQGYGQGEIKPEKNITREEAMAMIARAMKLQGIDTDVTESDAAAAIGVFHDGDRISAWAKEPIAACVKNGIVEGNGGFMKPGDSITRAETAAITVRMLNK